MSDEPSRGQLLNFTAQIAAAHLGHNAVPAGDVPILLAQVFETLRDLTTSLSAAAELSAPGQLLEPKPAVPIRKSITDEYLVCLEDGKKLKMLKRHLRSAYGLTPTEYRTRWKLSPDYPMVAPNYAARRSALAKQFGLGLSRESSELGSQIRLDLARSSAPKKIKKR